MRKYKISASFNFFEPVEVELPDKGVNSSMPKEIGEDIFLEFPWISYDYFRTPLVEPDDSLEISVLD